MCNFYIMFYTDSSVKNLGYSCLRNQYPSLTGDHFPADVSVPLPHNKLLEEEASGHHHHHGGMIMHKDHNVSTETTTQTIPTPTVHESKSLHVTCNISFLIQKQKC